MWRTHSCVYSWAGSPIERDEKRIRRTGSLAACLVRTSHKLTRSRGQAARLPVLQGLSLPSMGVPAHEYTQERVRHMFRLMPFSRGSGSLKFIAISFGIIMPMSEVRNKHLPELFCHIFVTVGIDPVPFSYSYKAY